MATAHTTPHNTGGASIVTTLTSLPLQNENALGDDHVDQSSVKNQIKTVHAYGAQQLFFLNVKLSAYYWSETTGD